jgi:hypothetical protein
LIFRKNENGATKNLEAKKSLGFSIEKAIVAALSSGSVHFHYSSLSPIIIPFRTEEAAV